MLTIQELDPFDDAQMAEYHAVYAAADQHGRRHSNGWALAEMTATLRAPVTYVRHLSTTARVDGVAVAVGDVELPQRDNTDSAEVAVHVHPDWQRQGIGTRLAHHLVGQARVHGRTMLGAWIPAREVGTPEDTVLPGERLAMAFGMRLGLLEVQRRLTLPVPPERYQRLLERAAGRHGDYDFLTWRDRCPDGLVQAYCALKAAMNTEAPTGDLHVENEHWDEGRLRANEQQMLDSGRTRHVCVAVTPDGGLAGHTELVVPAHDPEVVFQGDTLVRPEHRGHRLGLALKVRNLRDVQAAHPERTNVRTFNAVTNTHMVAVNEAIGFEAVEYMGEWQGPVPA